ncbi:MAG: PD-(D/E)XK nuclease family protein [Actinobacteria bacterium]|nr:PD-(D/E)XK nuclease family protein [Actinomycetota bacterium]
MTEGAGATARWVPVGRPASRALADAVTRAKGGDPLTPVTVAVPSVYAGLGLRRVLTAVLSGLLNVRFLVPARVAELLGAPRLAAAGRHPLTRALRAEAVRSALAADPGPFGDVAVHPATVRSVERAFTELRRAGPAAAAGMARGDERSRHLARVVATVRAATADCYDEHDLFIAAAETVRRDRTALDEVGHVVLHLPRRVGAADATLFGELAAAGGLTVLLGWTGDATADEPSRRVADRLGAPPPPADGPRALPLTATAERIVVAPDPDVEVRTVVRAVADRMAAGHPLDRMAVVYRSARPYGLLVHEHLAAAGIPHSGPAVRTLAQTAAGRVLLGLLRLPAERFSRRAVVGWLDSGPILETPAGDRAPAPRWDALSRAVGIMAGDAAWHDALVRHGRNLAHRLQALEDEGEGDDGQARGLRAELDHVARLDAFVGELIANATPPVRLSWTACAEWGRTMLARYLGGDARRGAWPDEELEAARAVESALDGLCALDAISTPGDAAAFATVLEEQLRAPFGRQGRFGDGVFVGRVADAACLDLDTVFVLGMAEGAFPERHRPDPLLAASPDRDPSYRRAEERRDFLWVASTAPERVLSYPAADQRGQRERLPSRWLLDAASALAERRLYTDDLATHPRAPWLDRVASFPSLLTHGGVAAAGSAQEVRLAALLAWTAAGGRPREHPLLSTEPRLALGLEAIAARRSHRLSRWTGLVGPLAGEAGVFEDVQSPTGVQTWATCPRRFLFERVLRVAETLRPEDELQMSAVDRGNLIHAALERFLDAVPARTSPTQPWTAEERAQLDAVVDDLFADAERRGTTGRPVLWRGQRRAIRRDVLGLLDRDEEMRAELGVVPVAGELSFGLDADGLPPVEVVTPSGRKVSFRGRIDRVDVAPDATRMVVFDYKSGSDIAYRALGADPVKGGRLLQLPVYALAARLRYGDIPTEAAYWFVGEKAGYRRIPVALDERTTRRLHEVLEAVGEGVDAGLFPANPGGRGGREGFEHCTYCPYDRVCPGDRQAAWERLQVDVALDPYRHLAPSDDDDR